MFAKEKKFLSIAEPLIIESINRNSRQFNSILFNIKPTISNGRTENPSNFKGSGIKGSNIQNDLVKNLINQLRI